MAARLLIIRFSSFGDIVQASPVPSAFRTRYPDARIDWLVRGDFAPLLEDHPAIARVIAFDRSRGLGGLIRMAWQMATEDHTHLYDAHNNLRSSIFTFVFRLRRIFRRLKGGPPLPAFVRRSKERLRRWLFFRIGLRSALPTPYRGSDSYLKPLSAWGIETRQPAGPQFFSRADLPADVRTQLSGMKRPWIVAAPSAAWEMKRWPVEHWQKLITALEGTILLLGGPEDSFLKEIAQTAPAKTLNLAGRLGLRESAALIKAGDLTIANDTGLLHVADMMERPAIALIGPTAFGYPSRDNSRVVEAASGTLSCKPCSKDGRGGCRSDVYKKCLVSIEPGAVLEAARERLSASSPGQDKR